jgi:branched-subunit amino acid transport protein
MNGKEFWIYLLILAGSTYLIRAIPFAAVRKRITNPFVKSFLYYIPYAVLTAMTFPAALYATGDLRTAAVGLLAGSVFAVRGKGLTLVAAVSCIAALAAELLLRAIS